MMQASSTNAIAPIYGHRQEIMMTVLGGMPPDPPFRGKANPAGKDSKNSPNNMTVWSCKRPGAPVHDGFRWRYPCHPYGGPLNVKGVSTGSNPCPQQESTVLQTPSVQFASMQDGFSGPINAIDRFPGFANQQHSSFGRFPRERLTRPAMMSSMRHPFHFIENAIPVHCHDMMNMPQHPGANFGNWPERLTPKSMHFGGMDASIITQGMVRPLPLEQSAVFQRCALQPPKLKEPPQQRATTMGVVHARATRSQRIPLRLYTERSRPDLVLYPNGDIKRFRRSVAHPSRPKHKHSSNSAQVQGDTDHKNTATAPDAKTIPSCPKLPGTPVAGSNLTAKPAEEGQPSPAPSNPMTLNRRGPMLVLKCSRCDTPATFVCSRCRIVGYCSLDCQKAEWKETHKMNCVRSEVFG